jgi:hypothetical protein
MNAEEKKAFEQKIDKMVSDQGELKQGIADIKTFLTSMGERLGQVEADTRVCRDVLHNHILATRTKEYRSQVDAKLSRPASLVFSRPNGSTTPPTTVDDLTDFINSQFEDGEGPDFVIEPMGKRGSFKLYPETYSPMESRRICATVLKAVKPDKQDSRKEDVKTKFGLNVFYDNPVFLREIRSEALRMTAQMLQAQGMKLRVKPFVKRDILILNDVPLFPEFLVPADESLWPACFTKLGEILRSNPNPNPDGPPLAQSFMEDMYTAGVGMIFPTFRVPPRPTST